MVYHSIIIQYSILLRRTRTCACVPACMSAYPVYVYVYAYVYGYAYVTAGVRVCMCVSVRVRVFVCAHAYMCLHVCIRECKCKPMSHLLR